jgi:hypothetical protein
LTFRTNASQESLFQELQNLKSLFEQALKASHKNELDSDPFSARQTRNLESLAKAAQQFHSSASSTASTRYGAGDRRSFASNWGGSEAGGLTDAQRERIERWNELSTVDESQEDSTTETTVPTDNSTTLTTPDIEPPPDAGKGKEVDNREDEDDDDDDDDESDVDLDFLRNFEELAYVSFLAQDYAKAEQCLRMAIERSTGDTSQNSDFKMLKTQLVLCCCLQEKWDHAAGILASLPKTRAVANLPIFHLLQAISLAHLEESRFDDAYSVCKTVLQGKKKIVGKTSRDYHECLSIFATICEKKGDALEAEAVRHSISRETPAQLPGTLLSAKQYILGHETLIDSVFRKNGDEQEQEHPGSPEPGDAPDPAKASGHWTTLVPTNSKDGAQRAEQDERKGTMIEETDTGKEFLVQFNDTLDPRLVSEPDSLMHESHTLRQPQSSLPPGFYTGNIGVSAGGIDQRLTPIPRRPAQQARYDGTMPPYTPEQSLPTTGPPATVGIGPNAYHPSLSTYHLTPNTGIRGPGVQSPYGSTPPSVPERPGSPKWPNLQTNARMGHNDYNQYSAAASSTLNMGYFGGQNTGLTTRQMEAGYDDRHPAMAHIAELEHQTRSNPIGAAGLYYPSSSWGQIHSHNHSATSLQHQYPSVASSSLPELGPSPPTNTNSPGGQTHSRSASATTWQHQYPSAMSSNLPELGPSPPTNPTLVPPQPYPHPFERQRFIEEVPSTPGDEPYSTLEVVSTSMSPITELDTPRTLNAPFPSRTPSNRIKRVNASVDPSAQGRTRWLVQKDISNIAGARQSTARIVLPMYRPARSMGFYSVGTAIRFDATDSFALSFGQGDISICEIPVSRSQIY